MSQAPLLESREAQPYMGIRLRANGEAEFRSAVDAGFPELFGWLGRNGVVPDGAPMIRYRELDADGFPTDFELGAPVATAAEGSGRVAAGELPAGDYAVLVHVGPYTHDEVPDLRAARERLTDWAAAEGVELAREESGGAVSFAACVESYLTDASREPDWTRWETELAYLTA
ncbi:MAG: GyrI-like domain-containing protein [Solirubrobacterales bacterium]